MNKLEIEAFINQIVDLQLKGIYEIIRNQRKTLESLLVKLEAVPESEKSEDHEKLRDLPLFMQNKINQEK